MDNTNNNETAINNIKLDKLKVNQNNPFAECKLGREEEGKILSTLVNNYREGFTMAVNGVWGCGKTTFIEMWQKQLELDGHKTILLNAWENDFVSEPLICILGELEQLFKGEKSQFEKIKEKAIPFSKRLGKNILPLLAKGLAGKLIGEGTTEEIITQITETSLQDFSTEVSKYQEQKETIQSFKKELEALVQSLGGKPLVFIVDELDRCRPDYAVELLEKIKHFFSVKGIVFVLAIDKEQLSASIRGHYGSESLNAEEYLRRFIDLEYALKTYNTWGYIYHLYNNMGFQGLLKNKNSKGDSLLKNEEPDFLMMATNVTIKQKLTLRQLEKILAQVRVSLLLFDNTAYHFLDTLFLLSYFRIFEYSFYTRIKEHSLSNQELISELERIFAFNLQEFNENEFDPELQILVGNIVKLISFYNTFSGGEDNPFFDDRTEVNELDTRYISTQEINNRLTRIKANEHLSKIKISDIIDRLDLISAIK